MAKPARLADLLQAGAKCDRSGEMWQRTLTFHAANPHIYVRLRAMSEDLRRRGKTFYSMRTLVCVLRYEADISTTGQEVQIGGALRTVTLNDHHSPYYARMLIEEDPTYAHFFELRDAEGDPVGEAEPDPMPPALSPGPVPVTGPLGYADEDDPSDLFAD